MVIPVNLYLGLATLLFGIGLYGVMVRRNTVVILMCVELVINAALINFVAFSTTHGAVDGQIFTLIGMSLAAAEAALGLALVLLLYRRKETVDIEKASILRW